MASEWKVYGVCECGFKTIAPFASLFHIHMDVCPDCGNAKDNWILATGRYVKLPSKLFKPSTWSKWKWEEKESLQEEMDD